MPLYFPPKRRKPQAMTLPPLEPDRSNAVSSKHSTKSRQVDKISTSNVKLPLIKVGPNIVDNLVEGMDFGTGETIFSTRLGECVRRKHIGNFWRKGTKGLSTQIDSGSTVVSDGSFSDVSSEISEEIQSEDSKQTVSEDENPESMLGTLKNVRKEVSHTNLFMNV